MTQVYNYSKKFNAIKNSIESLKKKNLLLPKSYGFFTPDKYDMFVRFTELQQFKEWTCNICQISVYGPNKLLIEHHKIHSFKRDLKENEIYKREYHLSNEL